MNSGESAFTHPDKVCDIVMKGGITSGVVYPLALVTLAKQYRFANIGGTSAGAMAAAAAAAAEYGRFSETGGFARLEEVPNEIGPNLRRLFQPTPALWPLFEIFVALLEAKSAAGKISGVIRAAIKGYSSAAAIGAVAGIVALILMSTGGCGPLAALLSGLVIGLVGVAVALIWRIFYALTKELPANDYGLCPGLTQPGGDGEGFTDWLARLIEETAGCKGDATPLTFGDLEKPAEGRHHIGLMMMTTSLMEMRPYTLPFDSESGSGVGETYGFVFELGEWRKLFPASVIDYLTRVCRPFKATEGEIGEFFRFPDRDELPVLVAARMSLSFPGLISAVPLWRRDFLYQEKSDQQRLRRCLFSDGGLSSNFPIHFFDSLLPNHPTFAISLDAYDEKRSSGGPDDRVWLHRKAREGINRPVIGFEGLVPFLLRLVDSAKDWQDNLQSVLPGYRERIAHIGLKGEEGGLNIAMDAPTVHRLADLGRQAGERLEEFDLDAHRWRRFLVAMARMEQTLDEVAQSYDGVKGAEPFRDFLDRYPDLAAEYKQTPAEVAEMLKRGAQLAKLGEEWRNEPRIRDGKIPRPRTALRITPIP
ncbi:MAG: hypothetical protein AB7U61_17295 [Methylocystis sp.]